MISPGPNRCPKNKIKLDSVSRFQNSKAWQSVDADSPVDAATGSLEDVFPKISNVCAALKMMALNLLAYVVIRLDVAAKAGAGHC